MRRGAETLQDISRAFLEHSPRPKLRGRTAPKLGSRTPPDCLLWVTKDVGRQLALIRGKNVRHVLDSAGVLERARWSVSAKGFVVPSADLADIAAMSDYANVPYRIKRVNADG